jgi:NAD(P) transhydrogenase subunit alpha
MIIGVPLEIDPTERRVGLVPEVVGRLVRDGHEVLVDRDAGLGALVSDAAFAAAGAIVVDGDAFDAEVVVKVSPPRIEEIDRLSEQSTLIGFLAPLTRPAEVTRLADAGVTSFAFELVPRITRAQGVDALSSQQSVAGYYAALLAAERLGRFFPMMMTAAGTIPSARVLVLGAGVAGMQAIATARRLNAKVTAYDVRPEVRTEVKSLKATFLELDLDDSGGATGGDAARHDAERIERLRALRLQEVIPDFDVVITTAQIPGRRAPILVTEEAVLGMKPGSVIVDLAAEAGGNCELIEPGRSVSRNDIEIIAPLNPASAMAEVASQLFARNVLALLELMTRDGRLSLDFDEEIIRAACLTRDGRIVNDRARRAAGR